MVLDAPVGFGEVPSSQLREDRGQSQPESCLILVSDGRNCQSHLRASRRRTLTRLLEKTSILDGVGSRHLPWSARPEEGPDVRILNRAPDPTNHRKTSLMNSQRSWMNHRLPAHRRRGCKVSFDENPANVSHSLTVSHKPYADPITPLASAKKVVDVLDDAFLIGQLKFGRTHPSSNVQPSSCTICVIINYLANTTDRVFSLLYACCVSYDAD